MALRRPLMMILACKGFVALGWQPRSRVATSRTPLRGAATSRTSLRGAAVDAAEASRLALITERRALETRLREIDDALGAPRTFHEEMAPGDDFGYLSKSAGVYTDLKTRTGLSGPPPSAFVVAPRNFAREFGELRRALFPEKKPAFEFPDDPDVEARRKAVAALTLSNDAIWAREDSRQQVDAPVVLRAPYYVLCALLDNLFEGRPIARFWFLETVARMPYFSYISMLHLYESFGWWRRSAEAKKIHFAEEWNEFHHLLTMESLGGDALWQDRFFAHHSAIAYYWVLVALWILSPNLAYTFSELIEAHAVDTYAQFADENREALAKLPAPEVIRNYYEGDPLFASFQTEAPRPRPKIETLLDVFEAIRDDEAAHVATMAACVDPDVAKRAQASELVTTIALALLIVPVVFVFGKDEICLLEECGRPERAELLSEFGL